MDSLKQSYGTYLQEFISALATGFPDSDSVQRLFTVKDKLDHAKHITYYRKQVEPIKEQLINKDNTLFDKPRLFIPTIDISALWHNATPDQRKIVWKYLQTLYLLSEQITVSDEMDIPGMDKIIKNLQETTPGNFSVDDILGGGDNILTGKMNDLVKGLAGTFGNGENPLTALQDPVKLQSLFSNVESRVQTMCKDESFNEADLKEYAENMKTNLENKLNIPLDSLMQNVQGMLKPGMLDAFMQNMPRP